MLKNFIKLLIAYWVIKHFVLDNELLQKIEVKIRDAVKGFLK